MLSRIFVLPCFFTLSLSFFCFVIIRDSVTFLKHSVRFYAAVYSWHNLLKALGNRNIISVSCDIWFTNVADMLSIYIFILGYLFIFRNMFHFFWHSHIWRLKDDIDFITRAFILTVPFKQFVLHLLLLFVVLLLAIKI